jgi:hypothetical protein
MRSLESSPSSLMQRAKMIPMSSPGWFDDFPEYMTETEYRDLSEEISRTIEIVHGHVIKCESPTRRSANFTSTPRPRPTVYTPSTARFLS